MPQIKSAEKRAKQTAKRTARNRAHKERLKKAVKSFRSTMKNPGDDATAATAQAVAGVQKALDKAGVKGIIHKNAVNRRKSRAAIAANKILAGAAK